MRRLARSFSTLLTAAVGLTACPEGDEVIVQEFDGNLEGRVTVNGQAAVGAAVQLSGLATRTGVTSGFGNYAFPTLLPGAYQVTATAGTSTCPTVSATVEPGFTTFADIACTSLATINVTVTSTGGSPVQGATVNLTGPTPGTAVTGANGTATFSNLQPGSYGASATRAGLVCPPASANVTAGATASATVPCSPIGLAVESGDDQQGEILVPLTGPFVAQLVANGTPLMQAGHSVSFTFQTGTGQLSTTSTVTDAQGRVQSLLTPGDTPGPIAVRAQLAAPEAGSPVAQFDATANRGPASTSLLGMYSGPGTAVVNGCGLPAAGSFTPQILPSTTQNQVVWRSTFDLLGTYQRLDGSFSAEASMTSGNTMLTERVIGMFHRVAPPTDMRTRFTGDLSFVQRNLTTQQECTTTYNIVVTK